MCSVSKSNMYVCVCECWRAHARAGPLWLPLQFKKWHLPLVVGLKQLLASSDDLGPTSTARIEHTTASGGGFHTTRGQRA